MELAAVAVSSPNNDLGHALGGAIYSCCVLRVGPLRDRVIFSKNNSGPSPSLPSASTGQLTPRALPLARTSAETNPLSGQQLFPSSTLANMGAGSSVQGAKSTPLGFRFNELLPSPEGAKFKLAVVQFKVPDAKNGGSDKGPMATALTPSRLPTA